MKLRVCFRLCSSLTLSSSLILLSVISSVVLADDTDIQGISLSGQWKNQRGAILEVRQEGNKLSGTFSTAVAKTERCINFPNPVVGYANGNALSLNMSLDGCGSPVVISMSSILMKDKQGSTMIKTQGLTQYRGDEVWNSQILTADYYYPVN